MAAQPVLAPGPCVGISDRRPNGSLRPSSPRDPAWESVIGPSSPCSPQDPAWETVIGPPPSPLPAPAAPNRRAHAFYALTSAPSTRRMQGSGPKWWEVGNRTLAHSRSPSYLTHLRDPGLGPHQGAL